MTLKNIEEAIVDRIQRAVRKELKALRRRARPGRNRHTHCAALARQAEAMALEAMSGEDATSLFDANVRGTVKEFAQLDGAFIVAEDGTIRAACRYLDASVEDVDVRLACEADTSRRRRSRNVSASWRSSCRKVPLSACSTPAN